MMDWTERKNRHGRFFHSVRHEDAAGRRDAGVRRGRRRARRRALCDLRNAAVMAHPTVSRIRILSQKYATFFFGVHDERSRLLTYTNAGHLPPLLVHNGDSTLLEVTGTVVGAFPSIRYEEQTVRIEPGALLIAYTDGITEPENEYGQDFGAERLAEVVMLHQNCEPEEITSKVIEAVGTGATHRNRKTI